MQNFNHRQQKPWYVQPWVWLLIALPATAVVGSMASLYLAVTTSDGLVVDDYYTRGKAINRDLARDRAAQAHRLEARFDIDLAGNRVSLSLKSQDYVPPREMKLSILHPTQPHHDQQVMLEQVGEGQYTAGIGELGRGKWYVQLEADDWRLSGRMQMPLTGPVVLSPRYTDDNTVP
jgi:uncharacterized protein